MSTGWKLILAGMVFNLFWLLAVIGQEQFLWIAGLILLTAWWLVPDSCLFSLTLAIPGMIMDSVLTRIGVFAFADKCLSWLADHFVAWFCNLCLERTADDSSTLVRWHYCFRRDWRRTQLSGRCQTGCC